nr:winged helix-turn-helix domain-containing protein [Sinorhizobium meliloti]
MPLGSRALDILSFLASHPGELKTNNEIVKQVWPNTFVDEANLRVHLSAVRKALGDTQRSPRFISNVPGRGYAFIAPLERTTRQPPHLSLRSRIRTPDAFPRAFSAGRKASQELLAS